MMWVVFGGLSNFCFLLEQYLVSQMRKGRSDKCIVTVYDAVVLNEVLCALSHIQYY